MMSFGRRASLFLVEIFILQFTIPTIKVVVTENVISKAYRMASESKSTLTQTTFLPIVLKPKTNFHARGTKGGEFYGVWATIETADPVIRERYFSYGTIFIMDDSSTPDAPKWVETGWIKSYLESNPSFSCIPHFVYAIQPGSPATFIVSPLPQVGVAYQYMIDKISDGNWHLYIMETNGTVIVEKFIANPGMNSGNKIGAGGEVHSEQKLNDMGISGLLSLKLRDINGWRFWDGWNKTQYYPYTVLGVPPDINNNIQISGNNGNPIPPDAPCP